MKQVDGTALLVTIAEDLSNEPVLKVWALDKTEKKSGSPKCLSTVGIHNGRKQFPVGIYVSLYKWTRLSRPDFGFCGSGELVAISRWLREWVGDSYSRGFDQ